MHCKIASQKSTDFKNKLGLNHNDMTLNNEQSVVLRILKSFPGTKMTRQYFVLNNKYRIDLYLPDYRLAIEIDEKGHMDRSKTKEKKKDKKK